MGRRSSVLCGADTTYPLSRRIFMARKKAGLSQRKVAEMLGLSQRQISAYESGQTEPTEIQVKQIESLEQREFLSALTSHRDQTIWLPEKLWVMIKTLEQVSGKQVLDLLVENGELEALLKKLLKNALNNEVLE